MNARVETNTLEALPISNGMSAAGNNDLGEIVGSYFDQDDVIHGFLYSNGAWTRLDDPAGVQGTLAESINNAGEIVGYSYDEAAVAHGFVYSNGIYTRLDHPAGVFGTFAERISDAGEIVGFYYDRRSQPRPFSALARNGAEFVATETEALEAEDPQPRSRQLCLDDVLIPRHKTADIIPAEMVETMIASEAPAPAATKTPASLRGFVDRVTSKIVEGWAQNPGAPDEPVCIDIVIQDSVLVTTLANRYRADLLASGIGSGRHAFSVELPSSVTPAQARTVKVRRSSDHAYLPSVPRRSVTKAA